MLGNWNHPQMILFKNILNYKYEINSIIRHNSQMEIK